MRKWNDDPYTKKARSEDYLARSVYKLEEIERRERIFSGVKTVLDLGASPGSWTQYALEKIPRDVGRVYAVDISPAFIEICAKSTSEVSSARRTVLPCASTISRSKSLSWFSGTSVTVTSCASFEVNE